MANAGEPLAGMTLNERLYARGLFDRFDQAMAGRNRDALRTILIEVEVQDIDGTADQLLNSSPEVDF
jgi:hypothetical protein